MTTSNKQDYYDLLGVHRGASDEDIKRAFRKLAMEYHPDRNQEDGAEDRFKSINAAYEVLSDPEKRARFDRFGQADGGNGHDQDERLQPPGQLLHPGLLARWPDPEGFIR